VKDRDRLVELVCSRRGTTPVIRRSRTESLDEIRGCEIELDRALSRRHHDSRYIFANALKAILSVSRLRSEWEHGRARDVATYYIGISGESLRLLGEEYRKCLMKRRSVPITSATTRRCEDRPEVPVEFHSRSPPPTCRQVVELEETVVDECPPVRSMCT